MFLIDSATLHRFMYISYAQDYQNPGPPCCGDKFGQGVGRKMHACKCAGVFLNAQPLCKHPSNCHLLAIPEFSYSFFHLFNNKEDNSWTFLHDLIGFVCAFLGCTWELGFKTYFQVLFVKSGTYKSKYTLKPLLSQ